MFSFFPCCSVHSFRLKKNDSAYLSHGSDNVLHSLSCLRISCLHTWRRLSWVREGSKANLDIKQLMSWEIALLNFSLFCFPFWSIIDDGSPYPRAPKISLCSSLLLILVAFNTSTSFDHFFLLEWRFWINSTAKVCESGFWFLHMKKLIILPNLLWILLVPLFFFSREMILKFLMTNSS